MQCDTYKCSSIIYYLNKNNEQCKAGKVLKFEITSRTTHFYLIFRVPTRLPDISTWDPEVTGGVMSEMSDYDGYFQFGHDISDISDMTFRT